MVCIHQALGMKREGGVILFGRPFRRWPSSAENKISVQKGWRGGAADTVWKDRLDRMQGLALSEALHCSQPLDRLGSPFPRFP